MKAKEVAPAQLRYLAECLDYLPPIIARKQVNVFTGGWVTTKTLANDDCKGIGPRKRFASSQLGVAYPTAYLLEYLERKGVEEVIITDEVVSLVQHP